MSQSIPAGFWLQGALENPRTDSHVNTQGQQPVKPLQRDDLSICFYSAALVSHPPALVTTEAMR